MAVVLTLARVRDMAPIGNDVFRDINDALIALASSKERLRVRREARERGKERRSSSPLLLLSLLLFVIFILTLFVYFRPLAPMW